MFINLRDLVDLTSDAASAYTNLPTQARLEGTSRDMTESERRAVAYYEAVLRMLSRKGAIVDAEKFGIVLKPKGT